MNYRAAQAFHEITEQLALVSDQPAAAKTNTPTKMNYFNNDFVGYVQFDTPTKWSTFEEWFRDDKSFDGQFSTTDDSGFEILESDAPNSCAVLKLDDRAFLVGNKQQLLEGVKAEQSKNEQVSRWLEEIDAAGFQGELFFAKRMNHSSAAPAESPLFLPTTGPWKAINEIEQFKLAIDFNSDSLLDLKLGFLSDKKAEAFRALAEDTVKSSTSEMQDMVDVMSKTQSDRQQDSASDSYDWQMRQMLAMAKSLKFGNSGSMATITVPRPAQFESLVKRYCEKQNQLVSHQAQAFQPLREVDTRQVFVAKKKIQKGSVFTPEDISIESWPEQIVPEDAIRSLDSVKNRKSQGHIPRGMPLLRKHFD